MVRKDQEAYDPYFATFIFLLCNLDIFNIIFSSKFLMSVFRKQCLCPSPDVSGREW